MRCSQLPLSNRSIVPAFRLFPPTSMTKDHLGVFSVYHQMTKLRSYLESSVSLSMLILPFQMSLRAERSTSALGFATCPLLSSTRNLFNSTNKITANLENECNSSR